MNVYISGALAGSTDIRQARLRYQEFASLLAESGQTPYLPHKETDPEFRPNLSPEDVFEADMRALLRSDLVVAFMDEPSLGVGAEIAISLQRGIRVIGVRRKSTEVSRFVQGLISSHASGSLFEYTSLPEIVEFVLTQMREHPSMNSSGIGDAESAVEPRSLRKVTYSSLPESQ